MLTGLGLGPGFRSNRGLVALASDSFDRADGGLGSTDGAGYPVAGGAGLAWRADVGTWAIASNMAKATAVVSSVAIATVDVGWPNVTLGIQLNHTGAVSYGVVACFVDVDNYIVSYLTASTGGMAIKKKVAGSLSGPLTTSVVTFAAGKELRLRVSGTQVTMFYDGAKVGNTITIADSALRLGTRAGLYTTSNAAGVKGDNFYALLS